MGCQRNISCSDTGLQERLRDSKPFLLRNNAIKKNQFKSCSKIPNFAYLMHFFSG